MSLTLLRNWKLIPFGPTQMKKMCEENIGPLVAEPRVYVRKKRLKKTLEITTGKEELKPLHHKVCLYISICMYVYYVFLLV